MGVVDDDAPAEGRTRTVHGKWWSRLDCDDPISLEAIADLPYPPFEVPVGASGPGAQHRVNYFDGRVLA